MENCWFYSISSQISAIDKKGGKSDLTAEWRVGGGDFFSPFTGNPPDLWENLSSPDLLQNRIEIKDYGLQSSRDIRYRCCWKIRQSEASLSDFSQSEERYKRLRMSVTWSAQSCACLSWWPRLGQDSEESLDEVCNLTQESRPQTLPHQSDWAQVCLLLAAAKNTRKMLTINKNSDQNTF